MSWFDKFFKKKEEEDQYVVIKKDFPLSTLARWFIYDTELAEPNKIAAALGLNQVSEEGDEKEREDSDLRLEKIMNIMRFINMMSEVSADVITAVQVSEILQKEPENKAEIEREMDMMKMLYKLISFSAIVGALSSAMEIGLITMDETLENMEWDEDE